MFFFSKQQPHTNSSSVHEVIFTKDKTNIKDFFIKSKLIHNEYDPDEYDYGISFDWGIDWIFNTNDKITYFICQLWQKYYYSDEEFFNEIINYLKIKNIYDDIIKKYFPNNKNIHLGIDHQSLWWLPDKNGICHIEYIYEYIKDIYNYIINDNVGIKIGNDNDPSCYCTYPFEEDYDEKNILNNENLSINDPYDPSHGEIIKFIKETYKGINIWKFILNYYGTPTVIRIAYVSDINLINEINEKYSSIFPESIDLKITDECHFNCPFCYVDSKENGKSASFENIKSIFEKLSDSCFEVALGGGDPTFYKDKNYTLNDICTEAYKNKIFPNITTKNYKEILNIVGENYNAIGISISNLEEMKEFEKFYKELKRNIKYEYYNKMKIHIIPELNTIDENIEILKICLNIKTDILYLGYKNTGRGKTFLNVENYDYVAFLNAVYNTMKKTEQYVNISVDTVLKDILFSYKNSGNDEIFFNLDIFNYSKIEYLKEGQHSFYIDAVKMKYGKSSWLEDEKLYDINLEMKNPFNKFKEW